MKRFVVRLFFATSSPSIFFTYKNLMLSLCLQNFCTTIFTRMPLHRHRGSITDRIIENNCKSTVLSHRSLKEHANILSFNMPRHVPLQHRYSSIILFYIRYAVEQLLTLLPLPLVLPATISSSTELSFPRST